MDFARFTDRKLIALYRVAKTRGYAFFRNPKSMIELRNECVRRNLL